MAVYPYNPRALEGEKGGSGIQGHFQPQSKVEAILGYTEPFLNTIKNKRFTFQCLSSYVCVCVFIFYIIYNEHFIDIHNNISKYFPVVVHGVISLKTTFRITMSVHGK